MGLGKYKEEKRRKKKRRREEEGEGRGETTMFYIIIINPYTYYIIRCSLKKRIHTLLKIKNWTATDKKKSHTCT